MEFVPGGEAKDHWPAAQSRRRDYDRGSDLPRGDETVRFSRLDRQHPRVALRRRDGGMRFLIPWPLLHGDARINVVGFAGEVGAGEDQL